MRVGQESFGILPLYLGVRLEVVVMQATRIGVVSLNGVAAALRVLVILRHSFGPPFIMLSLLQCYVPLNILGVGRSCE